ncbi:putative membrane-bound metal-dependent hydrolase [Schinkia azotoformans MEV2011]|uniref:Putative membrane-bound metal-dependent hydrolase n=1 Tax=Schinkia azotoformans MEV2011 TaxID=1348973 RepID=A0A072P1C2_SCHAZ|nr:metal-dependent hydrolase [Schinkia azotoformans]KEF39285.1 putative membrane-bound metal-dependent hydrolase [Schinkia azotoformans MEV2011]MEC1694962.1 metal-dependent hydrolase [Schinkia azotoformans]MEC1716168.1 metal-dependent hydrolase [Schinkia azotoformans]MEC1725573.1 metal-dependent hydrolase [Schinkia azotoformans]MEC1739948.1 metal-dependent hydrolase [Schinkia azotoformans]
MDTGTHVVMGIALGGLATLDPVVANHDITAQAVLFGTLIGSQAPDLDTIMKLKNNAKYIRNHRGITHSIPAVLLWPLLITGIIYAFSPSSDLFHLWVWTFIAVILHVFVDIFNAYGTQALRPFSKKWVALGIINTFDPFIFFAHIVGIAIWRYGTHPGYTFLGVYIVLAGYYLVRYNTKRLIVHKVKKHIPDATQIIVSPTYRFNQWHLAISSETRFYVARAVNNEINFLDEYEKIPVPDTPVMKAAMKDENLSAFLSFSPVYRWEIDEYNDHYEVRFIDLRYRSKGYYPFVAVVQLDQELNIVSSYTGWIFSEEKLMKKLVIAPEN